ncbi:hypothetical protein RZO07_12330 [Pseudomonas protegens]|uniref:hypothetical protein n=1 Tax=Pseudomonas protegens TaxID=380021 RepID=UPI0029372268|nr:hypothetical protein [Pseudomonas protegens]WOE81963.1 hypothetical protein RZO07_12330 [Pseudomonas protegens]
MTDQEPKLTPPLPTAVPPPPAPNEISGPIASQASVTPDFLTSLAKLNATQRKKKKSKAHLNTMKMRAELWPDLDTGLLWDRNLNDGYSTIPRTLSLITNIIDDLSKKITGKSLPAGKTYFGLWCRVWDENMLTIENETIYAIEAGYTGERNVTTWRAHMKVLHELGFIDVREGMYGPYNFVLIYNPYLTLKKLKDKISTASYHLLMQRAIEIGADSDLISRVVTEKK